MPATRFSFRRKPVRSNAGGLAPARSETMTLPLKKTFSLTVALITFLLAGMLVLGVRQYQLHRHHREIIRQTEQLLFQFSLIREHILASIVNGRPGQLQPIAGEVETFHANVSQIMSNPAIPDEYKLAFANQVDLPGLVLQLRNVQEEIFPPGKARRLNELTRNLGERLAFFDRMVLEHAKRQVLDFQTAVIGILALTVGGLIALLFSGHRRLAKPLFVLLRQIKEVRDGRRHAIVGSNSWHEVQSLATVVSELLAEVRRLGEKVTDQGDLLEMSKEVLKSVTEAESTEDLYQRMSRALLAHSGYCLVWLGVEEKESGGLEPVAADGSTTMSGKECKECMAVLLSAAEQKEGGQNQTVAALQSGEPVVRRHILAGMPKGTLKNTPFAEKEVSCASVPLVSGDDVLGVVNLYSLEPKSFDRAEMELLLLLARLAAARLEVLASVRQRVGRMPAGEAEGNLPLEINNMCNGIINYAQLLTDELGGSVAAEQNLLLAKIIKEGERIAALVGPLA
jgi:hypothetical protein